MIINGESMEETLVRNKAAVMDALQASGITTVRIDFRGDSSTDRNMSRHARATR